jgi:DNA modification methylase
VGHTRLKAAKLLGLTEAPVHVFKGTPAQVRAYRLADNKTGEAATWDMELLAVELKGLEGELDLDMALLGFADALAASASEGLTDPDELPAKPKARAKAGELWKLGRHRLLCGDCTDEANVERLLDGEKPFLMVTDPPYGVEYDAKWRDEATGMKRRSPRATGIVSNDGCVEWDKAFALFEGAVAYTWHAGRFAAETARSLIAAKFEIRSQVVWVKTHFAISRGHYHWQHEPCWYATRGSAKWSGDRKQTTVWKIEPLQSYNSKEEATGHSTQKPVECMARPIRNHGDKGDAVYDPFLGSGTTLIACEQLGRTCYALELEPTYVDLSIARWEAFTGEKAVRA